MKRNKDTRLEPVTMIHHPAQEVYVAIPYDFPSGYFDIGQKAQTGVRVSLPKEWREKLGYSAKSCSVSYENALAKWMAYMKKET